MELNPTKHAIEACLLVAGRELSLAQLVALFEEDEDRPDRDGIRAALDALHDDYASRGIELVEVASGWRLQSRASMTPWVSRLFQERAPRYSRALLETLVLIAYRQPVTRGEIEEVRGVAVSSNIVKTLHERDWIREVGHKDVPGKPALLGTTRQFLDYFNLKRLEDLPSLVDLEDSESLETALANKLGLVDGVGDGQAANDGDGADVPATSSTGPESVPEPEPEPEAVQGIGSESSPASVQSPVSEPGSEPSSDAPSRTDPPDDARPAAGSESDANAKASDREVSEQASEPAAHELVTGTPAPLERSAGEPVDFERYRRAAASSDAGTAGVPFEAESESGPEGGFTAGSEGESENESEDGPEAEPDISPANDSRSRLLRVIDAFAAEHRQDLDDPEGADPAGAVDPESGQAPPERDDGIP